MEELKPLIHDTMDLKKSAVRAGVLSYLTPEITCTLMHTHAYPMHLATASPKEAKTRSLQGADHQGV